MHTRRMWKVPRRSILCESFTDMLRQTFWCHVVVRIFPFARDISSDSLLEMYVAEPRSFFEQYEHLIVDALADRKQRAGVPEARA